MFKFLRNDKRGISLMEMIVAVTIVGFVISLAGQLLANFTKTYNKAVDRWDIQSAVQLACNKFETSRDLIANAYKADLIYDTALEDGYILYNTETGAVDWNGLDSSVLPAEDGVARSADDLYTYIYSIKAYEKTSSGGQGRYLGYFLFMRDYMSTASELFLNDSGFGEVPVKLTFRVATSVPLMYETKDSDDNVVYQLKPDDQQNYNFMASTVEIAAISGKSDVSNYQMVTQYTLNNSNGRAMTVDGPSSVPVLEKSWTTGDHKAYPAGWYPIYKVQVNDAGDYVYARPGDLVKLENKTYVTAGNKRGQVGELVNVSSGPKKDGNGLVKVNYIEKTKPFTYGPDSAAVDCTDYVFGEANIMRFVSEQAMTNKGEVAELTSNVNVANCLTKLLFSDGTKNGARTITALRDFRDNVLKGTAFGDWFIDNYYNNWSPALVKACGEHEGLKPVLKSIISPLSKVLGLIAVN